MTGGKGKTGLAMLWVNLNLCDGILDTPLYFKKYLNFYMLNHISFKLYSKINILRISEKIAIKIKLDPF